MRLGLDPAAVRAPEWWGLYAQGTLTAPVERRRAPVLLIYRPAGPPPKTGVWSTAASAVTAEDAVLVLPREVAP
jgi:hypothetical protein